MYTAEAEEALLAGDPDFVVDAIDNIDTKVRHLEDGSTCISWIHLSIDRDAHVGRPESWLMTASTPCWLSVQHRSLLQPLVV